MENGVWVFIESDSGTIADVSLELLWKGRELADQLRCELGCFIIGHQVSDAASDLIAYGADMVCVADHAQLVHYLTLPYTGRAAPEKPSVLTFQISRPSRGA